jgi:hypothetical protein
VARLLRERGAFLEDDAFEPGIDPAEAG